MACKELNVIVGKEVHSGYSFGERSVEVERVLEFYDVMKVVVANICFRKQAINWLPM